MSLATRIAVTVMVVFTLASGLSAQETSTSTRNAAASTAAEAAETTSTAPVSGEETATNDAAAEARPSVYEIRRQFVRLIQEHPQELWMILKLDPTLLSNQQFLANYPELATFVERYPEVRANGRFYLADFPVPNREVSVLDDIVEMMLVACSFFFAAFALLWLIRLILEQKRWNQLSRRQSEVHNKILDRFGTSGELLEYVRSPAGSKFLESAPIPVRIEPVAPRIHNAPVARIMWSIQLGVIVTIAAFGMLLASFRFEKDAAEGLFAMGMIAFCIGAGFIASAVVSLVVSKRLGVWQGPGGNSDVRLDDPGLMR